MNHFDPSMRMNICDGGLVERASMESVARRTHITIKFLGVTRLPPATATYLTLKNDLCYVPHVPDPIFRVKLERRSRLPGFWRAAGGGGRTFEEQVVFRPPKTCTPNRPIACQNETMLSALVDQKLLQYI
ncbi:hypothetical protein EVAR_36623_1 [Eumeta japonica]|uniref:Uncharacterized protein n=1 Tax=Eumeta variegata TaxID=151549 RepID=A0A4C1ZSH0_EUMVA|nr:hypothetical protein EVAR_36623_1 [Eumeta japonica]